MQCRKLTATSVVSASHLASNTSYHALVHHINMRDTTIAVVVQYLHSPS